MMFILRWILSALLIIFIAWIIPGITISNFLSAMLVVLVIGLVNIFIRPIVKLISLPLNFLTLGLFGLIINALLFLLVAKIAPGFEITGFWAGFFGALILSVFSPLINNIGVKKENT